MAAQSQYPLVFDSIDQLRQYGISLGRINNTGKRDPFPHRCYYYGDGGWDISITNKLLNLYKSQGFSRRSACMALVSGVRFNPEDGNRLATYIIADPQVLRTGRETGAGDLSDELPLSLPKCFRNGIPYSDCAWHFDPKSGKKLSGEKTAEFEALGKRIEKVLDDQRTRNAFHYFKSDSPYTHGEIMVGAGVNVNVGRPSHASFYDYSSEFPKGFGYALYADGSAAPEVSPEVMKAALNGSRRPRPQVDPDKLRAIVLTGSH